MGDSVSRCPHPRPQLRYRYSMKKRLLTWVLGVLSVVAMSVPFAAFAQTKESVMSFDVQAVLLPNRALTVTEQIIYNFGANQKHGIFRDIPVRYERNGYRYNLRLNVKTVQMDNAPVPYDVEQLGDSMRIKIGDPDSEITGRHTYAITYQTNRALNFFF